MFQSNLPNVYWSFVVLHSVYLINRLPSPVIQNKNPYETPVQMHACFK